MYPVQELVLSGEQAFLPGVRVWAWGEAGLSGFLRCGQVLILSLSSSGTCHHPVPLSHLP